MNAVFYLACEQRRPYKVFSDLRAAKEEIQPYLDKGYDFQVAEVKVAAYHEGKAWSREPA